MKVTYWVFDLSALDEALRHYHSETRETIVAVLRSEACARLRVEREIAEPDLPSPLRHMPKEGA